MNKAILHENGFLEYKCPACGSHSIPVRATEKNWQWNGDLEKPTISPSVKHFHNGQAAEADCSAIPPFCCHYFIKEGRIEFCGDCTHPLRGQALPLPTL